jgi:Ca-activated chloride channel family protein
MSFQSPWLLVGLLFVPAAVGVWFLAERRRMRYAVAFPNLDVLASVAPARSWLRYVPPVLVLLALTALLVSVARPEVKRMVVEDKAAVILVVDTSRSMQAEDVKPTRLAAAQGALRTFLDRAPSGLRVGLVVFAGDAQVATPPTRDKKLVETAVDEIDGFLVYGGTAIGDALKAAVELGRTISEQDSGNGPVALDSPTTRTLAEATPPMPAPKVPVADSPPQQKSPVSILFLSDGAQTRGILQPLDGAALAKKAGIPVYTIALGTPTGVIERGAFGGFPGANDQVIPVPPDPATLRQIAEVTGGRFSEARTAADLEKAYENLGSRLGRVPGTTEITFLFVAAAAVLLLLAGLAAAFVSPRLP